MKYDLTAPQRRALIGPREPVGENTWAGLMRRGLVRSPAWQSGSLLESLTPDGIALIRDITSAIRIYIVEEIPDCTFIESLSELSDAMSGKDVEIAMTDLWLARLNGVGQGVIMLDPFLLWTIRTGSDCPAFLQEVRDSKFLITGYRLSPSGLSELARRRSAKSDQSVNRFSELMRRKAEGLPADDQEWLLRRLGELRETDHVERAVISMMLHDLNAMGAA